MSGAALLRPFRRAAGFSALVALTVALGVGTATGLAGYFWSGLHPRFAAPYADRIVAVRQVTPNGVLWSSSSAELDAVRDSGAYELVAANTAVNATVASEAGNVFAWGQLVEGDYFELLGGRAALGRLLTPEDDAAGAAPVTAISHRLWRHAFASDPTILGRAVKLNGKPYTIVGVTASDFEGLGYASEFFVPARFDRALTGLSRAVDPRNRWLNVRGRLPDRPDSLAGARERIAAAFAALDVEAPLPEGERRHPRLVVETDPGPPEEIDPYYEAARLLAAAGVLFVLLGAANVAGLLLARAAARDREWALRQALGARPLRLAAEIAGGLAAPALLGLAGALPIAKALERWIERTLETPMAGIGPHFANENSQIYQLDARGAAFAVAATLGVVALAALPPFARLLRRDPQVVLRAQSAGGGDDRAVLAPRRLLVAAQLGLAVVLLVGSGLLARSLASAAASEIGFETRGLAFAYVNLPMAGSSGDADLATYVDLLERARGLPGVEQATVALIPPLAPLTRRIDAARAETPEQIESLSFNVIGPGYFETLGAPILAGRALDARDTPEAPPAVVVSAAAARRLWGDASAVGRRIHLAGPTRPDEVGPDFEVVGVAADAAYVEPTQPKPPLLFFAYGQRRHSRMTLVTRGAAPLATLEPALRDAVASARADASVIDLVDAAEQHHRTLHAQRLNASVAGGLAAAGLATAVVGLFALQAFTVQLRRRELAVRLALGARGRDLAALVLRDAARLAALGAVVGLAAAAATARLLENLLVGVTTRDPWTFVGVPLLLAAAVLAAAWFPARRAASVDPAENLRAL